MIDFKKISDWMDSVDSLKSNSAETIATIAASSKSVSILGERYIIPIDALDPSSFLATAEGFTQDRSGSFVSTDPSTERGIDIQTPSIDELEKAFLGITSESTSLIEEINPTDGGIEDYGICDPEQQEETPTDFASAEISAASCEPDSAIVDEIGVTQTGSLPIIPIETFPMDRNAAPARVSSPSADQPSIQPEVLEKIVSSMKSALDGPFDVVGNLQRNRGTIDTGSFPGYSGSTGTSQTNVPLFDSNGPLCFESMSRVADEIRALTKDYTDANEEIQKLQLEFFHRTLIGAFYASYEKGYDAQKTLRLNASRAKTASELAAITARAPALLRNNPKGINGKTAQNALSSACRKFSSQLVVNADSIVPQIEIDESRQLSGSVVSIPESTAKQIQSKVNDDPSRTDEIKNIAKIGEQQLSDEYESTKKRIEDISFLYGANSFIAQKRLTSDFKKATAESTATSESISNKFTEAKKKKDDAEKAVMGASLLISDAMAKAGCNPRPGVLADSEAGSDLNMKNVSRNPTMFDHEWWVKFSKLATIMNLVPVHWPIGLLIPTPAILVKVPLPIIWIPLFVASTGKSIAVLFIGQCGILPCPFLFMQHFFDFPLGSFTSNNPYFVVGMRGPVNISDHEPLFSPGLPSFEMLNGQMNIALERVRSNSNFDLTGLLSEARKQVANIRSGAQAFAAQAEKQANDSLNLAQQQVNTAVKQANQQAEESLRNAQQSATKDIEAARERYSSVDQQFVQEAKRIQEALEQKKAQVLKASEEAKKVAKKAFEDSKTKAQAAKDAAQAQLRDVINKGKREYEEKLNQIEQIGTTQRAQLQQLRSLINEVSTPAIPLQSIDVPALMTSYSATLGSMRSIANDISPKGISRGFLVELLPSFSASLPLLTDEFPVWERLSLNNIPFLFFLWKWCSAGKETGGFFRDPF